MLLRFLMFAMLLTVVVSFLTVAFFLFVVVVACLALAAAVGLPLYFMLKPRLQGFSSFQYSFNESRQSALDRLKNLYVEGKIDLFEFERRAAHLISSE